MEAESESSSEPAPAHMIAAPAPASLAWLDNSSFALEAADTEAQAHNRYCRPAEVRNSSAARPENILAAVHILAAADFATAAGAALHPDTQAHNQEPPLARLAPEAVPTAHSGAEIEPPTGLGARLEAVALATAGEEHFDIAVVVLDRELAAGEIAERSRLDISGLQSRVSR